MIADTTDLSTFPGFPTTPTTPGGSQPLEIIKSTLSLPSLEPGQEENVSFYLRSSTMGGRAVSCQLRYMLEVAGELCVCSSYQVKIYLPSNQCLRSMDPHIFEFMDPGPHFKTDPDKIFKRYSQREKNIIFENIIDLPAFFGR